MNPPEDLEYLDAVVVGAGVAGLVAADLLHAAGLSVRVLEARHRVGGRTLSAQVAGGVVDLGATWFWPGEEAVAGLVRRFGLQVFDQAIAGDAILDAQDEPQRVRGNPIDVPAYRFTDGAQTITDRLAAVLPQGSVQLSEPVTRIAYPSDAEPVVVHSTSGPLLCGQVVLAVPPALAAASIEFDPGLPAALRRVAESTAVWMAQTVKTVAVYERPFWREAGLAGAAISYRGPFRELHDHSAGRGTPAAIFGFADGRDFEDVEEPVIAEAFTRQLVRLFGPAAATPSAVLACNWAAEEHTRPSDGAAGTGSTSTYGHPDFHWPVAGRIHWASTETSARFPGHLEGGVHAGRRAAEHVLAQLDAQPSARGQGHAPISTRGAVGLTDRQERP